MAVSDTDGNLICHCCVGEDYLSSTINTQGKLGACSYCKEKRECFELEMVGDLVEEAFDRHYQIAQMEPDGFQWLMMKDKELAYNFEPDGEPVTYAIMNAIDSSEEVASDLQSYLAEKHYDRFSAEIGEPTQFSDELHYEEKYASSEDWQSLWDMFEKEIKSQSRFFSQKGMEFLTSVFKDVNNWHTTEKRQIVANVGPDTEVKHFFRARVFQSETDLEQAMQRPDQLLGPPPSRLATAGRMNAQGISVFYGATSINTAVSEVRPPVGSYVLAGQFEILRSLRLLDLTSLEHIRTFGSYFDPDFEAFLKRAAFMRRLGNILARPVLPNDEAIDYVVTQAVADYLASDSEPSFDGIMFKSVQAGDESRNVVLFNKASRVEEIEFAPGTKLSSSSWEQHADGVDRNYEVKERIPRPAENEESPETTGEAWPFGGETDQDMDISIHTDNREKTLKADKESMTVSIVRAANYVTEDHDVTWWSWEEKEAPLQDF